MSNVDLKKLAEEAKQVLRTSEQARTKEYNRQPHLYTVNRQTIISEALVQIGRTRDSITKQELEDLTNAATKYCHRLHDAFMAERNVGIQVFAKSKVNFYVIITADIDAYRKIYQVRVSEKGGLRKFTNDLHKIFPESKKIHTVAFDVGHKAGSSIAELTIQRALARFTNIPKATGQGSRVINRVISIAIRSYEKVPVDKSFFIEVKDESAVENQRKGREEEKQWIAETREALNQLIKKVDWPNQKGSRSAIEAAVSELLSTSKKAGAKVNGKILPKSSPSNAKTKLVTKGASSKPVVVNQPLVGDVSLPTTQTRKDWSSLIKIINAKLPEQVTKNMGEPGLVFRTGRFANSTKVASIETTREGYPSIVYDYQRDPYDVFDRVKGASPWNTPARDPKALVDRSVREIVQDLAVGRFYTRRA